MRGKKANLGFALTLFSMLVIVGVAVIITNPITNLTGAATYNPALYLHRDCYINAEACINLNGDNIIDDQDEEIFAKILNGQLLYSSLADFDDNTEIDNEFDFQTCFVPLRDYYIDIKGGRADCNLPPKDVYDAPNFENCSEGCADLNGDGYVTAEDYEIFRTLLGNATEDIDYPGADLDGNGRIEDEDKNCMNLYFGRIVTCNLPNYFLHTANCPDLTDEQGIGNDGFVDDQDKDFFDTYFAEGNLKVDFNNDGIINWLDKLIFEQYYEEGERRVVDCDLYHAPWHVGGIHQQNVYFENTNLTFGGSYNLSQSFIANCQYGDECQFAKVRLHLRNRTSELYPVVLSLYNALPSGEPNETYAIATTSLIPSFELNRSSWITISFENPPVLKKDNLYSLVVSSPESSDNSYEWYYNNITLVNISTSDASFKGEDGSDSSGYAVASGDINKDGFADVIIGAPDANVSTTSFTGKVYLFYGPVASDNFTLSSANASWHGENHDDRFGESLATGDINKDGYDDIIIGAKQYNGGGDNAGAVYVVYGPIGEGTTNKNISSEAVLTKWYGESNLDDAGTSVASGDINNDGYDDIIVGAERESGDGGSFSGAVYVIYGPDYSLNENLTNAGVKVYGKKKSRIGNSVASGDINSDGYDDIIIGAKYYDEKDEGNDDRGAVYLVHGESSLSGKINSSDADAFWKGESAGDFAGSSVASGDINNDGYDDIIIGAESVSPSEGKVYLVYGPTEGNYGLESADASWYGSSAGDKLGGAVTTGDIDNDGFDDILATAYRYDAGGSDRGAAYAIYGPINKETHISIESGWGTKWYGEKNNDKIGETSGSLAIGDINDDGFGDVIIGAQDYSGSVYTDNGITYLLYAPFPRNVNGSVWSQASSWASYASFEFLFQFWMTTACADLDSDGVCNIADNYLIEDMPDNMRHSGTPGWRPAYDLNGNEVIDSDDADILEEYEENPQISLVLASNCSAKVTDIGFGYNRSLAQIFTAPTSMLYYIDLPIKKLNGAGTKNITIRILDGVGDTALTVGAPYDHAPIPSSVYNWKRIRFDPAVPLTAGADYYIVVSSLDSPEDDAYAWSNCTSGGTYYTCIINLTQVNCTLSNETLSFKVYEGNNDSINTSLDVNEDGAVNSADFALVEAAEGNRSGAWLAKIDFDALFGVFDRLQDYVLGFKAYLGRIERQSIGKVVTCGLPNWEKGKGNGRCDYRAPYYETYVTAPEDCAACNFDGFCASSEDFTYCIDCIWPDEIPIYDTFGCDTTDFANVPDISDVQNAVIEDCDYGKIVLLENADFTGLSLDHDIGFSLGYLGIVSPTLDALNKSSNIHFYNLTYVYPWILYDGAKCSGSRCTFLEYQLFSGNKNNIKFNVSSIGTIKLWDIQTIAISGDVGKYSSIDLDNFGRQHIAYYDDTSNSLQHAKWNGLLWSTRTVDSDAAAKPISLIVDSKNQPHIVYCNSSATPVLKHAHHNGVNWVIRTIESSITDCDYASLAVDSNDNLHVSYVINDSSYQVKYAYYDGTGWTTDELLTAPFNYTSIAVDSSSNPHISFVDSGGDLTYAYYNGTDPWEITIFSNDKANFTSIDIDTNNMPRIAYYNSSGFLKYAKCISNCSDVFGWSYSVVDDNSSQHNSLFIDTDDKPHISYSDTSQGLKYAYYNGSLWIKESIDSETGTYNSITLDQHSNVYVSYYNTSDADLRLASLISKTNYSIIEAAPDISTFTGQATTNLSINTGIDLNNVSQFTLENQYGKVEFLVPVNISPIDLERLNISFHLKIEHNNISLASMYLPMLDKPARLTLYDIEVIYPNLLKDGMDCLALNCKFISYEANTLVFNVTEFSSYSAEDIARPYIPSLLVFSFSVLGLFIVLIILKIVKTPSE